MKKNFPFKAAGKDDARVLDSIKNDVRKYVKRERRKAFPEGFSQWEFNCKVGPDQAAAGVIALADLIPAIDALAKTESPQVYVEILAFASVRPPKPSTLGEAAPAEFTDDLSPLEPDSETSAKPDAESSKDA